MKKILGLFLLLFILVQFSGCLTLAGAGDLPPGQEKKITGDQNARDAAPGQNK